MRHATFTDQRVLKEIKTAGTVIFLTCDKKRKITSQTPYQEGTALLVGGSRNRSPVTGDFFGGGIGEFHVPWGRLSL